MAIGEGYITATAQPKWVYVFSLVLALVALSVLVYCFTARFTEIKSFKSLPAVRWLVMAIYIDSYLFVFSSTVLQSGFGLNAFPSACNTAILLCLACYLTSKILYLFLVEKAYIIRGRRRPRNKDKLYLFNTIVLMFPYLAVIALTFYYRNAYVKKSNGACYIGIKLGGNIPLLAFDAAINVYLTALFLVPLTNLHSYKQYNTSTPRLRNIARRTFICSLGTLMTTIANLAAMIALKGGEPGWVCFACCNIDVLVSAMLLHWVTRTDKDDETLVSMRYNDKGTNSIDKSSNTPRKDMSNNMRDNFFTGEVFANCVAGSPKADNDKSRSSQIPLGRIACTTETIQETCERRDVESLNGSEDRINPGPEPPKRSIESV